MTKVVEFEAGSEAEAVKLASESMGITPDDVEYTVVDEGSGDEGDSAVKIRVQTEGVSDASSDEARPSKLVGPAPEKAAEAEKVLGEFIEKMGTPASIEMRDEEENIVLVLSDVEGEEPIGDAWAKTRPPVVPAVQFLLNKVVNRFPEGRKHIVVEVPTLQALRKPERPAGEAKKTEPAEPVEMPTFEQLDEEMDPELDRELIRLGLLMAQRAVQRNRVITVHPMAAGERRTVHQTVTRVPGAHSVSEGEGLYRKLHVVPNSLGGKPGVGKKRRRRRRRPSGDR
ncbi:MAG: R3H domain-containing nucleic acid-binding protein [Myxococcota bacterium]